MERAIKRLNVKDAELLSNFFEEHISDRDKELFKPFAFDVDTLTEVLSKDIHLGCFDDGVLVGHGMARWQEEYTSPMLGIVVSLYHRRKGIGYDLIKELMHSCKGNSCIKCKVFKDNAGSMLLFIRLGFNFKYYNLYEFIGEYYEG